MKLFQALFDIATLPFEVTKDVFSLGGSAAGRYKSYTRERLEKLDYDFTGEPYDEDERLFD